MRAIKSLVLALASVLVFASSGLAEVRYYIVPKIGDGLTPNTAFRAKYTDPDSLGAGWFLPNYQTHDYGQEDAVLLRVDTTPEQHATLTAQVDVVAFPADVSANVGGAALATVQAKLEGLNIPGNWVTTANTYQQVLKAIVRTISFMQRWKGQFPTARLFGSLDKNGNPITLSTTFNSLTAAQKTRLQAVADSFGLDTSGVTNTMTIRQALKLIADQLPDMNIGGDVL